MHYLLGRFKVDFTAWKAMIDADEERHRAAGLRLQQAWTNADDPSELFFLFTIDDLSKAKAFLAQAGALDKQKQDRGEIPRLVFLDPK